MCVLMKVIVQRKSGMVFVDIVSNLERIGDHAVNIAEAILGNRA